MPPCWDCDTGVGKLFGVVADEPGPLADMVGADIISTHHARFDGVAERFQFIEQPVSAASSEIRAVFKSEPARAAISDQADGFEIEARPLAVDPFALGVGAADVLAGRATDDDVGQDSKVGNKASCRESAHVLVESDMWIVLCIKDAPPFDDFGGDGDEAGAVQAERPAARRRAEQVEGAHHGAPRGTAPAPRLACVRVKEEELAGVTVSVLVACEESACCHTVNGDLTGSCRSTTNRNGERRWTTSQDWMFPLR